MLQNAAGPRIEPPVSEPSAPWASPAASAAAEPLEEPPGMCSRLHGFFAGWKRWPGNWRPKANSCVMSLPSITQPARWSRVTHVASSSGTQSARTAGSSGRAARESRAWIGASASVKSLRTISRRFSTISIPAAFIRARTSSRVTASSSVTFLVQQRERAGRVRRVHRRRRVEVRGVERREPVHAEEPHRDLDLVLEQLEHADQTCLARRGEPAAREAPDADTLRAERQGLDDVSAAHEAAVHDDRRPAADRPDDLGERLDRAPAVVELAPAVVGNVHALDAVVGRKR